MFIRNGALVIISRNNERLKIFKSIKLWLFILFFLIGMIPCGIIQSGILSKYEERAVSLRTMDVRTQCDMIANRIIASEYMEKPDSEVINGQISQLANLYDGRILVINQHFQIIHDTYSMSTGKTMVSEEVLQCFKNGGNSKVNEENNYIELTVPIMAADASGNGSETVGIILASASTDSIHESMDILVEKNFLLKMVVMIILIAISLLLSIKLVKPFERITEQIGVRFDGYGKEEIDVSTYLETEQISEAFNQTINRMKVLDDSRQEFVSNVSHELKTPITSMKVLADSLLMMGDGAPVEMYQEFMSDITAEIDRESKIIDDLLSLVKMDKTAADLNIVPINVNELLELILKRLGPIAKRRNIELVLVCERQVVADADEVKLTLAISNFVENAIKYNKDNGWVNVHLDADHKNFTITVEDSGMGIPEEDFEHIFERFYRVDKSHSREIGGTGLGLAIARSAILMHRGAVEVESTVDVGTKFTIRIPLIYTLG